MGGAAEGFDAPAKALAKLLDLLLFFFWLLPTTFAKIVIPSWIASRATLSCTGVIVERN